jgi:hypothetical protein
MAVSGVPDTNSAVLFAVLLSSLWQNISSNKFPYQHLIYKNTFVSTKKLASFFFPLPGSFFCFQVHLALGLLDEV